MINNFKNCGFWFISLMMIVSACCVQPVLGGEIGSAILSDFDVMGADIRDVFRSIAEIGDINVLLDPTVKGEVTIKLKHGLSVKESLEMLAQTYGYSYRWVSANRTIIIGNEKTFTAYETKETKVYQLNYAQTDQVLAALQVAVPKDQIGIDKRTNQLTVRASALEQQNIAEIIKRLDREMPQINIEARVEEITRSASKDLGITWNFGQATFTADKTDEYPGLTYSVTTTATLNALEEQNKARMLACPNISTLDSQEGKIFIGERYPIVTSETTTSGTETTITYVEFGTSLKVTPRINEDNVVTVSVQAYVSSDKKWIELTDGNQIPLVSTREASSVVRLKEGETFVLSGLNLSKSSFGNTGVPTLSKIPVLGRLFGTKSNSGEETELVIFLTPKIVKMDKPKKEKPLTEKATDNVLGKKTEVTSESEDAKQSDGEVPRASLNTSITEAKPEAVKEPGSIQTPTPPAAVSESSANSGEVQNPATASVEQPRAVKEEQKAEISGMKVKYKVKPGDTVLAIAAKYGVTSESIRQANKIGVNTGLTAGKEIIIPIPENHLYTLKPKETLWRLAKRYGTKVELLMEINHLNDYTNLGQGQRIILPVAVDRIVDSRF